MKKLLKQLLAVTTAIMMAITLLPAMANAANTDGTTGTSTAAKPTTIKGDETCKLIIEKKDKQKKEEGKEEGVPGATFTAYKVAELTTDEHNTGEYRSFQLVSPFSEDEYLNEKITKDNLNNLSTKELEENATKVREVAQAAEKEKTENSALYPDFTVTTAAKTDELGKTTMDLGIGYYLVVETGVPTGYVASKPFFVAMPTPSTTTTKDGKTTTTGWKTELTVEPKNEQVNTPEKTADNETVGTNGKITYTIKGSTVAQYSEEDGYDENSLKYWISDKFPKDFSLEKGSVQVYTIDATNKREGLPKGAYTLLTNLDEDLTTSDPNNDLGDNTLLVKLEGKQVTEQKGKTIYVQYTAVADNPNPQNKNSATVIFTNDPNGEVVALKTDKTVSSFKIQVMKTGEKTGEKDSKPLAEATFKLLNEAGEELGTGTSDAKGNVTFKKDGKDIMVSKGTYYLEETEAPSGYSLLNSKVKVVIGEENNTESKVVFYYNVNNKKNKNDTLEKTYIKKDGVVEVSITNKKGFNLPSTGGMGTYIFTIGGLVVMAGAVLLLVSSKKKRA